MARQCIHDNLNALLDEWAGGGGGPLTVLKPLKVLLPFFILFFIFFSCYKVNNRVPYCQSAGKHPVDSEISQVKNAENWCYFLPLLTHESLNPNL